MYHKCGTSVVHKRGLTRFLDDLGIMHLMYVNLKYICQNMDNVLIVAGTPKVGYIKGASHATSNDLPDSKSRVLTITP